MKNIFKKKYKNLRPVKIQRSFHGYIKAYKFLFNNFYTKDDNIGFNSYPELSKIQTNKLDGLTWIGHASFLIQLNGVNILTDPIWSTHAGTTKRSNPVPFELKRLPRIDFVLISHSHFDHLDLPTLKQLDVWNPTYLVPDGLKSFFLKKGFDPRKIIEHSWWNKSTFRSLTFQFVPAKHWSRRGLFDINTSHWGGWLIKNEHKTVYFAGDTGYFNGFRQIAMKEPTPIDYALLPIGAYGPQWFNKHEHLTPEEAIHAFLNLKAKQFIPMHYGTFRIGEDSGLEAKKRLINEWSRRNLPKTQLNLLNIGDSLWI